MDPIIVSGVIGAIGAIIAAIILVGKREQKPKKTIKIRQSGNIVGGDQAGRDINKS